MKNNKYIFFFIFLFHTNLFSDTFSIQSKNISLDKNKELSIFKNDVFVKTNEGDTINSNYAEHNKKTGFLIFKDNVKIIDKQKNIITTQYAEYSENKKQFKSNGKTKIITSENYVIEGEDIELNNNLKYIRSDKKAVITDTENNKIYLDNFEYLINIKIFKSIGYIEIKDKQNNTYKFSQVYIDTSKKEILGTDVKSYLNDSNFKINTNNKPRILANTINVNKTKTEFNKSIFTLCDYRKGKKGDKCPPWTIQASKMTHNNVKKTIYYDNALIKVYNIPIFYIPKLSHPDPTVNRRSGFLPATLTDTKNLGSGITVPYFLAINKEKDFTFANRLYANENPLFMGEYRQAFENSNLILDMGYTDGYKNTTKTKTSGDKSHFFSKFEKKISGKNNSETSFSFQTQNVSNDKYLKLYRIKSNLVNYNQDVLESYISFSNSNDDYFLSANSILYENLKDDYNDKYEYILPEIIFDTNLFTNKDFGSLDLQSNFKINNFDTNKTSKFLINDLDWNSRDFNFSSGVKSKLIGKIKNVNYENKNIEIFKEEKTNEIHGAIGYLVGLDLLKRDINSNSKSTISPKLLLRYAPGSMRKEKDENGTKLDPNNAFSLNRMSDSDKLDKGLSTTIGFDYNLTDKDKEFNLSVGQIINNKESEKMASVTSLNEKLSDLVGAANLKINNNIKINYNFSLDQNYNDFNYNEIISTLDFNPLKINFGYLQESKHIGSNEYFKTKINYDTGKSTDLSFATKRNLITNSSEYYDMSYEYYNDCLRAALVFRREFYNDSELEPENSLMFKITLVPFGNINTPAFNK